MVAMAVSTRAELIWVSKLQQHLGCKVMNLDTRTPLPSEERITKIVFRTLPEGRGQNLAVAVFYVPHSLDSGYRGTSLIRNSPPPRTTIEP